MKKFPILSKIKSLSDSKANKVIKTTVSVTTQANGVASLSMTQANAIVVALTVQDYIAIPMVIGSGRNWWVKVVNWTDMTPVANTAVSVDVLYIVP